MLIIRRRVGERVVIGSEIEVTIAAVTSRAVRLAFDAPRGVPILRGEVHDAIVEANHAATASDVRDWPLRSPSGAPLRAASSPPSSAPAHRPIEEKSA